MLRPKDQNFNHVYDYNKLNGVDHPSQNSWQIRRNIDARAITVENSSTRPVGVAISTGGCCDSFQPKMQFIIEGGEVKFLGINSYGDPLQFIHLLDPTTGKPVGHSCPLSNDSNQYVLRDGLNAWWTQRYKNTGYKAAI